MYNPVEIGKRICLARNKKNMKQSDVCKILHIGQSTYSKLENGTYSSIPLKLIYDLAELFDVPVAWLAGFNEFHDLTAEEMLELENYKEYLVIRRKLINKRK